MVGTMRSRSRRCHWALPEWIQACHFVLLGAATAVGLHENEEPVLRRVAGVLGREED